MEALDERIVEAKRRWEAQVERQRLEEERRRIELEREKKQRRIWLEREEAERRERNKKAMERYYRNKRLNERSAMLRRIKDDSGPRDVWLTYGVPFDPRLDNVFPVTC